MFISRSIEERYSFERALEMQGHIPGLADSDDSQPHGNMDFDAQAVINTAQIIVVVHSHNSINDLATLRNGGSITVVRGVVDTFGKIPGHGYDVEITAVV